MLPQMTTLLDALPGHECNFWEEISTYLLAVNEEIEKYFPELDYRSNDTWICRPFSVNEAGISDGDVAAKIEFQLREDFQLRIDFTEQELPTFWAEVKNNCPRSRYVHL